MTRVTLYGQSSSLKALQSALERLVPSSRDGVDAEVKADADASRPPVWGLVESKIKQCLSVSLPDAVDWAGRAYTLAYPLDAIVFTLMPTVHVEGLFESHTFEIEQQGSRNEVDFVVTFFVSLSALDLVWQTSILPVGASEAPGECC